MKKQFLLILCILMITIPGFAQDGAPLESSVEAEAPAEEPVETPPESGDFWISLGAEAAMYTHAWGAYGGSLALGYGKGAALGLKAAYLVDVDGFATLELNFLLRFYLRGAFAYSGPFLQFSGGPVLFAEDGSFGIPSRLGMISAGLGFGWRFLFRDRWFVEPAIRVGYPYLVGLGLSGGIRF